MGDEEYVVEEILQAKVAHKRKGKVAWKYLVKWKGYDEPEDNTWEPVESFTRGSEHIIQTFWDRAWLDDRDRNDADSFRLHELIYPTGPPAGAKNKRKTRRKSEGDVRKRPSSKPDNPEDVEASEPEVESILEEQSSKSKTRRKDDARGLPLRERFAKETPQITYKGSSRRKSMPDNNKPTRKTAKSAASAASSSLSSAKKRKFDPQSSSEDDSAVIVPLTKIGPPRGVKKRQKRKLDSAHQDQPATLREPPRQDSGGPPSVAREKTPPGITEQGGLSMDTLFSSPVARTIERSSGFFSTLAADSDHESNSEKESNKSRTSLSPTVPVRRTSGLPFHRDRAANPRVKMMDLPDFDQSMKGAISVKAKLIAQKPTSTAANTSSFIPSSSSQAGLDRPSGGLLSSTVDTAGDAVSGVTDNGLLEYEEASSLLPMTTAPLVEVAGLKEVEALELPDFEEEPMQVETEMPTITESVSELETTIMNKTPPIAGRSTSWMGNTTIFGLLTRGSPASSAVPLLDNSFSLNLDSSVSVPLVLKDVNASSSLDLPPLGTIITQAPRSPTGKFYKTESSVILDTLKTGGPSARLSLKEGAMEMEKLHFDRFRQRLRSGNIFVTMAGPYTIAIVSSESQEVCEKLGVPTVLRGLVSEIVVSAVVIEDYSAYAEAALLADDSRWL